MDCSSQLEVQVQRSVHGPWGQMPFDPESVDELLSSETGLVVTVPLGAQSSLAQQGLLPLFQYLPAVQHCLVSTWVQPAPSRGN
jgi:hypothetical protein